MANESTPAPALEHVEPTRPSLFGAPALYLTGEESLRVTSFGSVAGVELAVRSRYLDVEGQLIPSSDRHVPHSDRSVASTIHPLGRGWLVGVQVYATVGPPRIGQVFVVVELVRGDGAAATPLQPLFSGYVTATQRLGWPGSPLHSSTEGRGVLRSITGTNPAAGVEVSETVPTDARWHVLAFAVTLVTSAAAANRELSLTFDDGATVFARVPSGYTHIASLTRLYSAYIGAVRNAAAQDTTQTFPLPDLHLQGGYRIATATTNKQAGDDYGAPQLLVEEWIED